MIRGHFVFRASRSLVLAFAPRSGAAPRAATSLDPALPGDAIPPLFKHAGSLVSIPGNSLTPEPSGAHYATPANRTIWPRGTSAKVLAHSGPHARNAFDAPHALEPHSPATALSGSRFMIHAVPASVTKFEIELV